MYDKNLTVSYESVLRHSEFLYTVKIKTGHFVLLINITKVPYSFVNILYYS